MQVYHGLNRQMYFRKFHAYFKQPLSATSSFQAAQMFTGGVGIILALKSVVTHPHDVRKMPKYLSISWLSDFPGEDEKLFYGGYFEISNIIAMETPKTRKQHSKELSIFNHFQNLVQNEVMQWDSNINSDLLTELINNRRKSHQEQTIASPYGTTLFNYFCNNQSCVTIQRFTDLPQNIKTAMFYIGDDISIFALLQIFPKLQEIALTELNIEEMEKYTEAVYKYIYRKHRHLQKVSLKSKRELRDYKNLKQRTVLKQLQEVNHEKFKIFQWSIKYQYKIENTHNLIFTNNVNVTADQIQKLQERFDELGKKTKKSKGQFSKELLQSVHFSYWESYKRHPFCKPKYKDLKTELLNNTICPILPQEWNTIHDKAAQLLQNISHVFGQNNDKNTPFARYIHIWNEYCDIKYDTPISMNHLLSIFLHTHLNGTTMSIKNVCIQKVTERMNDVKERHREFAISLRLLAETIMFYGGNLSYEDEPVYCVLKKEKKEKKECYFERFTTQYG
eukprot:431103_1